MFGRLADHPIDILVIVILGVVLFGSKRLPDAARGLGRSMRIFKSEISAMNDDKPAPPAPPQTPDALEGRVVDGEEQPRKSTEPRRDA